MFLLSYHRKWAITSIKTLSNFKNLCHSERRAVRPKPKNLRIFNTAMQIFGTKILRLAPLAQDDIRFLQEIATGINALAMTKTLSILHFALQIKFPDAGASGRIFYLLAGPERRVTSW